MLWLVRSVVLFLLGVGVILDAILTTGTHLAELVVGLVLLGYTSIDRLGELAYQPRRKDDH